MGICLRKTPDIVSRLRQVCSQTIETWKSREKEVLSRALLTPMDHMQAEKELVFVRSQIQAAGAALSKLRVSGKKTFWRREKE
jgi:hypothetical protein